MNKREFERKQLNARCIIRYVALDGRSVEQVEGRTFDISRGGIGIRAELTLRRHTPVHVTITGQDGKTTAVTGLITNTRTGKEGGYLVGVQLQKIHDKKLLQMLDPAHADEALPESSEVEQACENEPVGKEKPAAQAEIGDPK